VRLGPKGQLVSFVYVKDLARALWDAVDMNVNKQIYVVSDGNDYDPSQVNQFLAKHLGVRTVHVKIPKAMVMGIAHVRLFLAGIRKKPLHVSPFKIREITSRNWRVDNSKMVRELNFQPKYTLESGLKEALMEDGFMGDQ